MTTWYARASGGSDNNGGTSYAVRSTGTDGATSGTNTLTSASAAWSAADIGHGIFIGGVNQWRLITAVGSATSLTFSGATIATATGRTWTVGGAFATFGKPLGSTTPFASADTLYAAPGVYREAPTVNMTSPGAETLIIGDTDGSHTSGVAGPVIWTAYTTNDTTAPSANSTLSLNGRDFLTFRNIIFVGGSGSPAWINPGTDSRNITFTACAFLVHVGFNTTSIALTAAADVNSAWLFDRCWFEGKTITITVTTSASADYDCGILFRNCFLWTLGVGIDIASTGAGAFKGGGVDVLNCTVIATSPAIRTGANLSTTIPCTVNNSIVVATGTVLTANTSGQLTESYNLLMGTTARTNVSAGTGSISDGSYAPMWHLGQELAYGGLQRPFLTPMSGSPLLNFGAGASPPSVDLLNRVRPSGGAGTNMGVGALERHDFGTKETGTIDTGGLAVRLTGPGDHQFVLPVVSGHSTTVTLKVNYDANHGTGTPPQATLVANNAVGYAGETVTAAASTGSFLTLTFAAFTPTANGYVIMRLTSRAAAGNGFAIFDTVNVT